MTRRALALLLLACACGGGDEAAPPPSWDRYDGVAYPSTRPKIPLPAGDFAIVPSSGSDVLAVVDLDAGQVVASSPVGRSPVVLDGPHQVVADRARGLAYVLLAYPETLETAGTHQHGASKRAGQVQVLALDDLRAAGEVRVAPNPGEIAVSDDGARLVVTHYDLATAADVTKSIDARRATLAVIDPNGILPFGTPEPDELLVCVAPHGVALSRPDGRTAFVACSGEDALAIVDVADIHAPVVRVPVGASAYGVALSPDGTRVAIGTRGGKDVRFLDVAARTMEPLIVPALGETYVTTWSADGSRLYVPTRDLDAITVVDAKTGTSLRQRVLDPATCVAPIEVARGGDGSAVHLVCEGSATVRGAVVTLDADTLETRARVDVGFFPGRPWVVRGR